MSDDATSTKPAPLRIGVDDLEARRRQLSWGGRVRFERLLRDWSQHDLARVAGVTQSQVARIERGARMVAHPVLGKIARAFVVPAGELFPFDDGVEDTPPGTDSDPPAQLAGALRAS